jgi:hypothetical protein
MFLKKKLYLCYMFNSNPFLEKNQVLIISEYVYTIWMHGWYVAIVNPKKILMP